MFNAKGRYAVCHKGRAFTVASFHDIGSARGDDLGRGKLFPTSVSLRYAFKTPTLRDVARRAPYMHDGALATLEGVIDLYDKGGIERPSRAEHVRPLNLTAQEMADLIAFMNTLTVTSRLSTFPRPRAERAASADPAPGQAVLLSGMDCVRNGRLSSKADSRRERNIR